MTQSAMEAADRFYHAVEKLLNGLNTTLDRLERIERLREKLKAYQMKECMENLESRLDELMRKTK